MVSMGFMEGDCGSGDPYMVPIRPGKQQVALSSPYDPHRVPIGLWGSVYGLYRAHGRKLWLWAPYMFSHMFPIESKEAIL